MMTSSNGSIFRVTGPLCREFTGPGEFPPQRPVTLSFDVFFDLHLNKRLSKQTWGWWFETPSWSLWRQCNEVMVIRSMISTVPTTSPMLYGVSEWAVKPSIFWTSRAWAFWGVVYITVVWHLTSHRAMKCHDMDCISVSVSLCEGNPPVTSQRTSYAEHWCLISC